MFKKINLFIALFSAITGVFGQSQRLVLFEEFTSEDCPNCAIANPFVEARINQNPNKVVCIRYQNYIPSGGPLYYADVNDVKNRMTYYGVSSAPWGQQDGALWDSSSANIYGNQPYGWATDSVFLDTEYTKPSPFALQVSHIFTDSTDSVYATVTITAADSFLASAPGKITLRVAMVENVQFAIPPGDNGETVFPNVVRHMYPAAQGTNLANTWHSGQQQTFSFSGLVPSNIVDKTQVRFVAFIQDDNNLHILQAGQSQPFIFALDAAVQGAQADFIHCSNNFTPTFYLRNNGTSEIDNCSVQIMVDGTSASTQGWAGSLSAGDSILVKLFPVNLSEGAHSVAIVAQNPNGAVDGNMGNNTFSFAVGVTPAPPAITPVFDGFETANNPGWLAESVSQLPHGWSRYNTGSHSNYSYQMDLWDIPAGDLSNLYAPEFTLAGLTHAAIKFDRAYAQYDFGNNSSGLTGYSKDSLYIEVSTNCGASWQNVYTNGGSGMKTAPEDSIAPFTPSASQWVTDSADLTLVAGNPDVVLRFKCLSGNGNELYIDNIDIYNLDATGINQPNNLNYLQLYPNPTGKYLKVSLQLSNLPAVTYRLINSAGQVVLTGTPGEINTGGQNFEINTSQLPGGLYLLRIMAGEEEMSKVFCVIH